MRSLKGEKQGGLPQAALRENMCEPNVPPVHSECGAKPQNHSWCFCSLSETSYKRASYSQAMDIALEADVTLSAALKNVAFEEVLTNEGIIP
ncbi:hypothetical protein MHYP_G00095010 [Metynnis hypsauchen]